MKLRRRALTPSLWDLVEAFFLASAMFEEVHESYESRVLAHAKERGVDRTNLRLDAETVSKLLDLGKLESLRNGPLHELKDIAHALFRRKASTDKLDRYVSEIFHELSILKEEQYKVSTFAPAYQKRNELEEYESILDEVHQEFPRKVHNIHDLFQKARWRLEAILRKTREETVLVRSLALFGDKILEKCYPNGIADFHTAVYPGGPVEAHVVAGRSFARGGFLVQARSEAKKGLDALAAGKPDRLADEEWGRLAAAAKDLASLVANVTPVELVRAFANMAASAATAAALADASTEVVVPRAAPAGDEELPPASADDLDDEPGPEGEGAEPPHAAPGLETRAGT